MRFFARVCSIILLMQHFSSAASAAVSNPSNSQVPNTTPLLLLIFLAIVILIGAVIYYQRNQKMTLMDALLSQSKDGIWVTDEQFRIIEINNAFSEISGYKKADVLGKKFKALTQAGRDTQLEEIIQQELSNDGYWSGEIWNLRKDGQPYAIDLCITKVTTPRFAKSSVRYVGMFSDVTARKNNERTMLKLTTKDSVTGLSNRAIFIESLEKAINACNDTYPSLLIIFIDIDNFKKINDSLGHTIGDVLLKEVACRLTDSLNSGFTIARLGADEFAVLVPPYLYSGQTVFFAKKTADIVLQQFKTPFMLDGFETSLSACCGLAIYPDNAYNCEYLMRSANSALNHAKKMGRNTYQFFDKERHTLDPTELTKESALFKAITNNEFELYFQPKFDAQHNQLYGFEALVRWPQEDGSVINPDEFIPLAEQNGAIIPLTQLLMEQLLNQLAQWRKQNISFGNVAINISALHFQQSSLIETLIDNLAKFDVPAHCLELEITESAMMDNPEFAEQQMKRIKSIGVQIALDDFGTGHSSLSYLKRFPIDTLKIDKSFVKDIDKNDQDRNITATIVRLAKYLDINVVAEGVETEEQAYMLHIMGCHFQQGYYYCKPLKANQVSEFINDTLEKQQSS
ncbi:EAL domain-containing protein [Pseudoalteromonas shioyasakiensis]|uniref:EAL domain-containing protein n=1 Tax=Pseudoalteromonas shioyasakiensis TaxID=1190813 RepID=A0ABT6U3K3_9GAMM|nr:MULTISPECIES: GGDEF domain-containing phosphodiesterase [Pseudoalteromonas]MDI4670221.1 EAL domain-containing protein [Pseudoalteromonas shioyasakiensis]MDI4674832.1 EAL domain-containing protein [Pseudoalteromonas shioyasakiensis]MDI4687131.1 EAL domain-containing protein [Pseudoalteromonas shioyasakiensis]MDI4705726.1 EAL domain-containing protein [Pseudoalteromonas shioyasakiensis]NUJ22061.1 EAL domain-containing protein [Pseudoalteromonas sp. 0802]